MTDDAEAAMGRALARQAWRRLELADSSFAKMRYPRGAAEYAELEWMKYREDAMAALSALDEEGFRVVKKTPGITHEQEGFEGEKVHVVNSPASGISFLSPRKPS